jgi:hypothetical protein
MDSKLMAKSAYSHCFDIGIRYFSFYAIKKRKKRAIRQNIVQIFIGQQQNPLLFFINVINFC